MLLQWFWARLLMAGVALTALLGACRQAEEPAVPIAPVHLQVNLNAAEYHPLASPAGMVAVSTPATSADRLGYGGLLIVRSLTEAEFYAYDLSCPYEAQPSVRLAPHDLEVKCSTCGSRFDVLYGSGSPISRPATTPLRRYRTSYNATLKLLTIHN